MSKALLKTTLHHALQQEATRSGIEIECHLKNISINGQKRGCSGHIVNTKTGVCVYINTEDISLLGSLMEKSMYRLAADVHDYSSNGLKNGYNRWALKAELAKTVIYVLNTELSNKEKIKETEKRRIVNE